MSNLFQHCLVICLSCFFPDMSPLTGPYKVYVSVDFSMKTTLAGFGNFLNHFHGTRNKKYEISLENILQPALYFMYNKLYN